MNAGISTHHLHELTYALGSSVKATQCHCRRGGQVIQVHWLA